MLESLKMIQRIKDRGQLCKVCLVNKYAHNALANKHILVILIATYNIKFET